MVLEALGRYLAESREDRVSLTFDEIEEIDGRELPASARRYPAWWANGRENTAAIMAAGYRVSAKGFPNAPIVFIRTDGEASSGGLWWVNQSDEYERERDGRYLFTHMTLSSGESPSYRAAINTLSPGDVTLHYARGWLRAVGVVNAAASDGHRPERPADTGRLVPVEYFELDQPIPRDDIPIELRLAEPQDGPFDRNGSVKEGYIWPLPIEFLADLRHRLPGPFEGTPFRLHNIWLFQANPKLFDLAADMRQASVGDSGQWTVTRHAKDMRAEDIALLYAGGAEAGIYGVAELTGTPYEIAESNPYSSRAVADTEGSEDGEITWWVPYRILATLTTPVTRSELKNHPALRDMRIIRQPAGTNFKVSWDEWDVLKTMLPELPDLGPITNAYAEFVYWGIRFFESDTFGPEERDYKREVAANLARAVKAFETVPNGPTGVSEAQLSQYLSADTPAEAARAVGMDPKRLRDKLRDELGIYVSRGGKFDDDAKRRLLPLLTPGGAGADWLAELKRAFGPPNNLTDWRTHDRFLKWAASEPGPAHELIGHLWSEIGDDPATRIDEFCSALPDTLTGRAARLGIASFLLFASDPENLPPFRNSGMTRALELIGEEQPDRSMSEGELYSKFLGLLDDIKRDTRSTEDEPLVPNRIDAQGILWSVTMSSPLDEWSEDDKLAFLAFRGESTDGEVINVDESELTALVRLFYDETGYPTQNEAKQVRDRDTIAQGLTSEALKEPDPIILRRLAGPAFAGPGPMPQFMNSVSSDEGLERVAGALADLLYGPDDDAHRIDRLLSDPDKVPGLGLSIMCKALSIVRPDEWIPVFPLRGVEGKRAMLRRLSLPVPNTDDSQGHQAVESNTLLRGAMAPHFGADTAGMRRFLYWLLQHEGEPTGPTLATLAQDLSVDEGSLGDIVRLLADRGQVIFYGPPGTGKTYIARRLAEFLAGQDRVTKVQFHPSYAYEDFVEGFRPRVEDGQPVFRLADGPLKRAAAAAAESPDTTHILLIDEINRGNIAKVFGELYFLLEYRDEDIDLQYSLTPFIMPENLWIIGTMNTADRSIALVDAALRRRFHFAPFFPDEPPIEGLLRRWLEANRPEMVWVADAVDRANLLLEDRHRAIGPSHFLRKDLDDQWVELIWKHSVIPYLAEQFFGEEERVTEFKLERLRYPSEVGDSGDGGREGSTDAEP